MTDTEAGLAEIIELHPEEGGLVVVDKALSDWVIRLEEIDDVEVVQSMADVPGAIQLLLGEVAARMPEFADAFRPDATLRVAFNPEIRRGLTDGTYSLMRASDGVVPAAVDAGGRVVGQSRVVGGMSSTMAGGAVVGGLAAAWPIMIVAAAGAAAAYSEQRWLEQTFGEIQAALTRLELRLRDDDHGTLGASNAVVDLARSGSEFGAVSDQLRLELAHARFESDRIYRSRRRFVSRFLDELEGAQTAHETQTGDRVPWVGDLAQELSSRDSGLADELVVYLQAMIVRARTSAATAGLLARDGDGAAAMHLVEQLEESTREDYYELYRRLRALARHQPDESFWNRLPGASWIPIGGSSAANTQAHDLVQQLVGEMESKVGERLPQRDAVPSVVVPIGAIAAA